MVEKSSLPFTMVTIVFVKYQVTVELHLLLFDSNFDSDFDSDSDSDSDPDSYSDSVPNSNSYPLIMTPILILTLTLILIQILIL